MKLVNATVCVLVLASAAAVAWDRTHRTEQEVFRQSLKGGAVSYDDLYFLDWPDLENRVKTLATEGFRLFDADSQPAWPAKPPLDWGANPFRDSDWRYQLNAWRIIEPHLALYEQTRDPALLETAMIYIADWYRFNVLGTQPNRYKWYDAATGIRSMRLAYLFHVAERDGIEFSTEEWKILIHLAKLHAERLGEPRRIVHTNHAFWQIHGWMALCRVAPKLAGCDAGEAYGVRMMRARIRDQFGKEGVHKEHSPAYHFLVFNLLQDFLATGWYDGDEDILTARGKILENAPWLMDLNGRNLEVGDSSPVPRYIGELSLPTGPGSCANAREFATECYGHRVFGEAGFATVRSLGPIPAGRGSLLFLTAAFHSKAHRHSDDLSLVWFDRGQWLLTDTGRYSYGDGERRLYSRSTRAHNTVEVDGLDYSRDPADAYGSGIVGISQRKWGYVIEGAVSHENLEADHARTLLYRPGAWLIVVDRLSSPRPRRWTAWFHLGRSLAIEPGDAGLTARTPSGDLFHLSQAATFQGCTNRLVEGQMKPRLQGWRAVEFRKLAPNPAWGFECAGESGTMLHAFLLAKDGKAAVRHTGDAFVVRFGNEHGGWAIRVPTDGSEPVVDGVGGG